MHLFYFFIKVGMSDILVRVIWSLTLSVYYRIKHISLELLLVINEIKRKKHEREHKTLLIWCFFIFHVGFFEPTELVNEWLTQQQQKFYRKNENKKTDKQQRFFSIIRLYICNSCTKEAKYMIYVQHNNGADQMNDFFLWENQWIVSNIFWYY